jgi:hypothetical protein
MNNSTIAEMNALVKGKNNFRIIKDYKSEVIERPNVKTLKYVALDGFPKKRVIYFQNGLFVRDEIVTQVPK